MASGVTKVYNLSDAPKANDDWVPISSGRLPDDDNNVQVTFLGYGNGKPECEMAYLDLCGVWRWLDGEPVGVKIVAWRYCEPYKNEE